MFFRLLYNNYICSYQFWNMLEDKKILLRAVEPEDLDVLFAWENNVALWDVGNTRQPYSRFALKQYISQVDTNIYESGQVRFMIVNREDSCVAGTVDLFDFDIHHSRIAFGLFVEDKYKGKGIATSALHLIEHYVFDFLNINQMYCHISILNTASKMMFEKEKYEVNGVLKNWIRTQYGYEDVLVFQRFKKTV